MSVESMACDESKCVSKGGSNLVDGSFTCWGDDDIFPRMCADGFLPVVVDSESSMEVDVGELTLTDVPLQYFTCCPPDIEMRLTSEETTRQCSDPKPIDNDDEIMECDSEETRKYPRQMKTIWDDVNETEKTYFSCCDSFNSTATSSELNFLDDAECVPYRDKFYDAAQVKNNICTLRPRICKIPGFGVASPIGEGIENALGEYRYQCCRSGDALQPFITDASFYITVYPALFLYLIAAVISVIVFLGLSIPLVKQIKDGAYARESRVSQSSRRGMKRYSTYNLYLVHLAFLDLCYCMFQIVRFASAADQQVYPSYYSWFMESEFSGRQSLTPYTLISTCYTLANMWINAIICYEVWILLKSSKQHKKRTSPSLTQVNLECGSVVLLLLIIAISFHYTNELSGLDIEGSLVKCLSALTYIPFFYVVYVAITIWWRGYIPSLKKVSANEAGLRQLALFFLRIVGVFLVIWIPTTLIVIFLYFGMNIGYWGLLLWLWLTAIQPIVTFFMILTKEDAKKYILDLVTFAYCRNKKPVSSFDKHASYAGNVSSLKCTSESIKNYSYMDSSLNPKSSNSSGATPYGERSTKETSFIGNESSMIQMEDDDSDEEEDGSSAAMGEQC